MPNPTITSSYAGEFAGKYLGAALLSASTLDAGAVTILPNIKFKARALATRQPQTADGRSRLLELCAARRFESHSALCDCRGLAPRNSPGASHPAVTTLGRTQSAAGIVRGA